MNVLDKLQKIKAFVFDIDGVLTNGIVLVTDEGSMLRQSNIKDGYALQHAVKQGYTIGIISGGRSDGMTLRLERLGIQHIYTGQNNKVEAFNDLLSKADLKADEVLYMADDMPDIPLLEVAGFPCCPADACDDVKEKCTYISTLPGGQGCVRDIIEKTMKLQDKWYNTDTFNF